MNKSKKDADIAKSIIAFARNARMIKWIRHHNVNPILFSHPIGSICLNPFGQKK